MTSILVNFIILANEISGRYIFDPNVNIFDEITGERKTNTILYSFMIACAVACLWYRAFYWMRVFERPAFFILLIKETLIGILPFLTLIGIILVLFSNVIYVFNMSRHQSYPSEDPSNYSKYTSLYSEESHSSFYSAFKHIWLISLGDYSTDDYENRGEI